MNTRAAIALAILAFAGGGTAIGWLSASGVAPWDNPAAPDTANPVTPGALAVSPEHVGPAPIVSPVTQPVADSARTEAMLVAMAARRAIDTETPLGSLAPRLQRAFGQSRPEALSTVLAADRNRLSLRELLVDFDATAPMLGEKPGTSWQRVSSELSNLFVLRRDDTPPSGVDVQLQQARDYLASGNVAAAMRFVASMPGVANAQGWLAKARRYVETRQALDTLEQAALDMPAGGALDPPAAPATVPTGPGAGETIPSF